MKKSKNALVILAGGQGKRFNNEQPKQFNEINGENLIDFFLNRIDTNIFDISVSFCKIAGLPPSEASLTDCTSGICSNNLIFI